MEYIENYVSQSDFEKIFLFPGHAHLSASHLVNSIINSKDKNKQSPLQFLILCKYLQLPPSQFPTQEHFFGEWAFGFAENQEIKFVKMATFSIFSSALPELIFLSPHNSPKRLKLLLSRGGPRSNAKILGRIRAVQSEESVLEERDRELAAKLNGGVNGNYSSRNGSVGSYGNGSVKFESENGSLAKYVNGNGNGNVGVGSGNAVLEAVEMEEVVGEKKSVEEIGQEEAWFKRGAGDQVEVDFVVLVLCYALMCGEF